MNISEIIDCLKFLIQIVCHSHIKLSPPHAELNQINIHKLKRNWNGKILRTNCYFRFSLINLKFRMKVGFVYFFFYILRQKVKRQIIEYLEVILRIRPPLNVVFPFSCARGQCLKEQQGEVTKVSFMFKLVELFLLLTQEVSRQNKNSYRKCVLCSTERK